ncbi:MAG: hypothetical protein HY898_02765 [Deltaproteobacteria bacterium]|nr:hypothetical protein [Deltaproteobacteria bacterium]
MFAHPGLIVSIVAAAGLSLGCRNSTPSHRVPGVADADALWGGGGFCARTPRGLLCWNTGQTEVVSRGPALVEGVEGVREVALRNGEACALDARGVACFTPGEAKSRRVDFDAPSQVVATHGYPGLICVLDAQGVSCWGGDLRKPLRRPEMGKPERLIPAVNGGTVCGVQGTTLRCFESDMRGIPKLTFVASGTTNPKAVYASAIGGNLFVLDDNGLRSAKVQTVTVGNPFAVKDPLDVDAAIHPAAGAAVTLSAVGGVGKVSALANRSIWTLALDETGVATVEHRSGRVNVERWVTRGVPHGLWSGYKDVFFTRDGDTLWERGWDKGKKIDRQVEGVLKPATVVPDIYWTCVLEEGGGVACVPSPKV